MIKTQGYLYEIAQMLWFLARSIPDSAFKPCHLQRKWWIIHHKFSL